MKSLKALPLFAATCDLRSGKIDNPDGVTAIRVALPDGRSETFKGRQAFALAKLHNAGQRGISTIELAPGLQWSDYVFKLRKAGIAIKADSETHGGPYSGHHARYRLTVPIKILEIERGRETVAA